MKLNQRQTAEVCRGLSLLLHAGISQADGVYLLAQSRKGEMAELLQQLGRELDLGTPLSRAMEMTGAFPEQAVGMIRVGEASGRLEEAMSSLADFYEERARTLRRIKNALSYPCMLLLLMLGVIALLLIRVLPIFEKVYASLGSGMTGIAAALLDLGRWLEGAMPVLLGILAVLAAFVVLYALLLGLRERTEKVFQHWLADRGIRRKFNNARFAQALSMGLSSGLDLEAALALAARLLEDTPSAARRCRECLDALGSGQTLDQAMEAGRLLPPEQSRLLAVGLRSGSAEKVLLSISRQLHEDAQESLEQTAGRVEPALVMGCSILVGIILLAVMLPLMNILSAIG